VATKKTPKQPKAPKQPGKLRTFFSQVADTYRLTAKFDRLIGLKMAAITAIIWGLILALGNAVHLVPLFLFPGFLFGLLGATLYFGRRAERAAFLNIEGQPGAAAAVMQAMRGGWFVTAGITFNRQQDLVHRVVSRAGITLVSEGPNSRVASMLDAEERKTARFAQNATITCIQSGNEPGQVPLSKLQKALKKQPKLLKPAEVTKLRRRFEALNAGGPALPIPKGPMPTSARAAKGARRGR
jgi:hypothetical protein